MNHDKLLTAQVESSKRFSKKRNNFIQMKIEYSNGIPKNIDNLDGRKAIYCFTSISGFAKIFLECRGRK
jgi:hypothetical protein